MFTSQVRISIVVLAFAFGIYRMASGDPAGYVCVAAGCLILFGYFRFGAIRPAFMAMRRGDLARAKQHLDSMASPRLLSGQSRAYYHWVCGVLAAQQPESLSEAEEQMQLALDGSLRTSHDRCLATATLAEIVARNHDLPRARQLLAEAQLIPHRPGAADDLQRLQVEFNNGVVPRT